MSSISAPYHCDLPPTEWQTGDSFVDSFSDQLSISDLDENWFKVGELANIFAQKIQGIYPASVSLETTASVVINELLENVVKYGLAGTYSNLEFKCFTSYFELFLTNTCSHEQAETFQFYLERLSGNLQAKSLSRLFEEKITLSSMVSSSKSELGMLMILKDYGSKLKIDLVPNSDGSTSVALKLQIKAG